MDTSNEKDLFLKALEQAAQKLEERNKNKDDVEYVSEFCCIRNRVNNYYLVDPQEEQQIRLFMGSFLSELD